MLAELQEEAAIERVRERMHLRYDQTVVPGEVDRVLAGAHHRFDGCRVRAFVPVLVERQVRTELDHSPKQQW